MRIRHALAVAALAAALACQPAGDGGETERGVVEVTADDFEFEAPNQVPSGWTSLRLTNAGEQDHFFVLWRLPEGKTVRDYRQEVVNVFSQVYGRYSSGDLTREETLQELGAELPDWFPSDAVPSGGVALTEAGTSAESTVRLEPGTHVLECYVKTPDGTWHTERGMVKQLVVTEEDSGAEPPEPDVELTLSNYEIDAPDRVAAGSRTVAVSVTDEPEGVMPHDINLFRLDEGDDVDEIVAWMDWMELDQFRSPAPARPMGGVENLPAGATGYMTADLEPGRYAWVSEEYSARGMVQEFVVE